MDKLSKLIEKDLLGLKRSGEPSIFPYWKVVKWVIPVIFVIIRRNDEQKDNIVGFVGGSFELTDKTFFPIVVITKR